MSSRNSEVIHGGIYYQPGSLKARLCVEGRNKLYRYCADRHISARPTGKLIVATSVEDVDTLEQLLVRGRGNGVDDLVWLSSENAAAMEPELDCLAALYSPSTGIVDSHGLMLGLQGDLESAGSVISFTTEVLGIEPDAGSLVLTVNTGHEVSEIVADEVINCASHNAVRLAQQISGTRIGCMPQAWSTKGNYFRLKGKAPFSHLVYPAPEKGSLGIHLVLDLAGHARFGPDVEKVDSATVNLEVDPTRAQGFYSRIRRYWPALEDHSLEPDYAGLRPKISRPGMDQMDFEILDESDHGICGLVHCLGIESPGLTSCLAIGDEVVSRLA